MRKSFNLIWMVFGFLLLIVGCNEDKKSTAFDPNQPVKFTEFMPDSGGIRTKFIVKGSNFGEDKSQVKVYFKDEVGNEREALVLGVKPDVISVSYTHLLCTTPKVTATMRNIKKTDLS